MAEYFFDTITDQQAMAIQPGDVLRFRHSTATDVTVTYNTSTGLLQILSITITAEGRSVTFSTTLAYLSTAGRLLFDNGSKLMIGDEANNSLGAAVPDLALFGGGGADTLNGAGAARSVIQGNAGDDQITGGPGPDTIYGGQGSDRIFPGGGADFVQGNKGNDSIIGGGSDEILLGGQGDDLIRGNGGNDFIDGNLGDDWLEGAGTLLGEDGADTIGGLANAHIALIDGGAGNDSITAYGSGAFPRLAGETNSILGGDGDDVIASYSLQFDLLHGGAGADTITSSTRAGEGDRLYGEGGSDSLSATSGEDTLDGGAGADSLSGGFGDDLFMLDAQQGGAQVTADHIFGFDTGDRIYTGHGAINGYFEIATATYEAAYASAQELIREGFYDVVAFQWGSDVLVFSEGGSEGVIGSAFVIHGWSLQVFDPSYFIG